MESVKVKRALLDKKIAVLAYHGVISAGEADKSGYNIAEAQFEEHMKFLKNAGCRPLSLPELVYGNIRELGGAPLVFITFDDGHRSSYYKIMPILQKYNFTAVFFIATSFIGNHPDFMSWPQVRELAMSGYGIQPHGHTHNFLNRCSKEDIAIELTASSELIRLHTGQDSVAFSCPGGRFNRRVVETARGLGYKKIFTSKPGFINLKSIKSDYLLNRWAIKNAVSVLDLKKIINCSFSYKVGALAQHIAKGVVKKIAGDNLYHNVYKILNRLTR